MSSDSKECLRCRGKMEAGYIADQSRYGLAEQQWMDGVPEQSAWLGLKTKGHISRTVMTYRCENCGYLESYAD